jgi:hypothetical protein
MILRIMPIGITKRHATIGSIERKVETSDELADRTKNDKALTEKGMFDLGDIPCDDSVGLYLNEMRCVSLLSLEEEVALAKAACRGRETERDLQL